MALDSCVIYVSYASGGASAASPPFRACRLVANRRMARVGADGIPDGVFYERSSAAGDQIAIADWHKSQTLRIELGGAVNDGHYGKIDAQGRAISDGANQTANSVCRFIGGGAAGDIVQVLPIPNAV